MGKFPDGLMQGYIQDLGSFHSCYELDTNNYNDDEAITPFYGKYCLTMAFPSAVESNR